MIPDKRSISVRCSIKVSTGVNHLSDRINNRSYLKVLATDG